MEISGFEKRRAVNLIWNGAHDYGAPADFRVFDEEGRAELYFNSLIGCVYRHYDREPLAALVRSFADAADPELAESLFWIALENAAFTREALERPVFSYLRDAWAEQTLNTLSAKYGGAESGADAVEGQAPTGWLRRFTGSGVKDSGTAVKQAPQAERILAGHLAGILDVETDMNKTENELQSKPDNKLQSKPESELESKPESEPESELEKTILHPDPASINTEEETSAGKQKTKFHLPSPLLMTDSDRLLLSRLNSLDPEADSAALAAELKKILAPCFGNQAADGAGKDTDGSAEDPDGKEGRRSLLGILPSLLSVLIPSFLSVTTESPVRRKPAPKALRHLAFGYGETVQPTEEPEGWNLLGGTGTRTESLTEESVRFFIMSNFGKQAVPDAELKAMERDLCTGAHEKARIYVTRGEYPPELLSHGVRYHIQEEALDHRKKNLKAFHEKQEIYLTAVRQMTERIRNSILMRMDERTVRSASGELAAGRVWRGIELDDRLVFNKKKRDDAGRLTVDILLDASKSQVTRLRQVSAQGYVIAESLTRCGIPCRMYSFCSIDGYTVVNLFRDYDETHGNEEVFRYFTAGANRDGLAVRLASSWMRKSNAEHRILIVLSDCKPNDPLVFDAGDGRLRPYDLDAAVRDTAAEVHAARLAGINVMCVFTGNDDDVPSARRIYGQDFVRIRSLDRFAERVGRLIETGIRTV